MNLFARFAALPQPTTEGRYAVERAGLRHRVGRSFEGYPAMLMSFKRTNRDSSPRRLANLVYRPPTTVEIVTGADSIRSDRLAILECRSTDQQLIAYFFRVISPVLFDDEQSGTEDGFESALDAVVSLFRSLQRPGQSSVQGIWAELAVIYWANRPETALSAWHTNPRALHDFASGPFRLEVKSSATGVREHSFQLAQLGVIERGTTIIASLLLDDAPDGTSVFQIVELIQSRVRSAELSRRLEAIVADSLGESWKDGLELRLDLQTARQRLRFYRADMIPSIPGPLPVEVKEVRLTVDISTTNPVTSEAVRSTGSFFADVLPVD